MNHSTPPKLPKWPFLAGDAFLLVVAYLILWQSSLPMTGGALFIMAGCVGLGAVLAVVPFLLEHRAALAVLEVDQLRSAALQIQNIESVARQISSATACWQAVQDESTKAVTAAREIAQSITTEARSFQEFLVKANDSERNHLRLEVDKLRRAEQEWLTIVGRMLDHTYALYQAGLRSGQPNLIAQLDHFQNACRDVARRIGLVPVIAEPGDAFDDQLHQLPPPGGEPPPAGAVVAGTLATGYRFQGQLLRRAVVTVAPADAPAESAVTADTPVAAADPGSSLAESEPASAATVKGSPAAAEPDTPAAETAGQPLEPAPEPERAEEGQRAPDSPPFWEELEAAKSTRLESESPAEPGKIENASWAGPDKPTPAPAATLDEESVKPLENAEVPPETPWDAGASLESEIEPEETTRDKGTPTGATDEPAPDRSGQRDLGL